MLGDGPRHLYICGWPWGSAMGGRWWTVCLLAILLATATGARADTTVRDRYYLDWLAAVEHLMLNAEYETFLTLDDDGHREHFIHRFWEVRSQDSNGWRSRALEGWRRNFEQTVQQFGGVDSDRGRAMLIAGKPDRVMALRRCAGPVRDLEIWGFSPWQVERQTGRKETDGFHLVFFIDGDDEEGYAFHQWGREDGVEALVWQQDEEDEEWDRERWLEFAGAKNCFAFDPQEELTVTAALDGALDEVELFERIRPAVPDAGWLADLARELAAGAATPVADSAELEIAGGYEGRTLVRGRIEIPLDRVGRTEGGRLFDRFVITGEVWSAGVPLDDFRIEHHVSGPPAGDSLTLELYRVLVPGLYTVSLRVEDGDGFGVARSIRELEVPALDHDVDRIGARDVGELTAREVAVSTVAASVQLEHPAGEGSLVAGRAEVRALTTGAVARVDFLLDGELAARSEEPPFAAAVRFGRLPRRRHLAAVATDVTGRELARDEIVVNGGPHRFALRLIEPVSTLNGRTSPRRGPNGTRGDQRIRAVVEVPERQTLDRVELFLDQRRVATLHQPPFLHPLPERAAAGATFVRAVATLDNGESVEDLRFLEYRGPVDEIDVRLVELYTSVTDPKGRFVLGLDEGDFQVLEAGATQPLTRFETIDRLPIHVALLLDVSGSMEPRLSVATESALRFFDTVIDPAKDRAALLTFNHAVRLRVPFTGDLDRLRYGVTDLAAWQGTRLHDGIIHAGHYFGGLAGKRALVLLSDGEDTASSYLFKQVLEHTLRSGVAVYPIAVDLVDPLTRKRLKQLATETGGSFYAVDAVEQLDDVYRRLEQELRSQYLLAYHAPDTHRDGFRTVAVRVTGPDGEKLTARTIHGYYP